MRKMGGLWKKIPYTYACMWIGSLALAGIPYFSGYFSKDTILEAAWAAGTPQGQFAYILGVAAAFLTAFYSWRLIFMTFHGKPRASDEVMHHVHESPPVMLLPLIPLVLGALFCGALGYYSWEIVSGHTDHGFWNGALTVLEENNSVHAAHHVATWVKVVPLVIAISGIVAAYIFYIRKPELPGKTRAAAEGVYQFLLNKWYFDELYARIFVRPSIKAGLWLWKLFDVKIIDGLGPNGVAAVSRVAALRTSAVQSGYVYRYAFAMLLGLLVLLSWIVYTVVR
jgi:NADH-quinone oxidoreductase subunit L